VTVSTPAAVLWDMDGTIVDTEPFWMSAQDDLVSAHGGTWTHEAAMTLVGSGLPRTAQILQAHGVNLGELEIIEHLTTRVMEQVSEDIPWRPGAKELLLELRNNGVKTALVTMSFGRMAEHIRSFIPFDAFDLVVSGDSVEHSKPHPEAYLVAAERLGVDIAHCVAIEDSVPGVASAVAAGAVTIGVPHFLSLDESNATVLWPSLAGRTVSDIRSAYTDHRQTDPSVVASDES
jgi:HAD superfamily hydrolase (TIGR01509 family)